jgi:hypothetical protein
MRESAADMDRRRDTGTDQNPSVFRDTECSNLLRSCGESASRGNSPSDKYEGTRLGRQELEAEPLEDTPGALWPQNEVRV